MSPTQTVIAMRDAHAADAAPDASSSGLTASKASKPAPASSAPGVRHGATLPLTLALLALLSWLSCQAWLLEQDRQQLLSMRAGAQPGLEKAQRLRRALDLLAADTRRLADAGNPQAQLLVQELGKRGVTIDPAKAATAVPGGPAPPAAATDLRR